MPRKVEVAGYEARSGAIMEVDSSFKSVDGLKWKPIRGVVQLFVDVKSQVQLVRRWTVYLLASWRELADASCPTRS